MDENRSKIVTLAFDSIIRLRGVNPFIVVKRDRATSIHANWRKPMPVVVRLNRLSVPCWRVNLMPVGDGSFYLYLNGDMRKSSNVAVGDRVRVEIEFDRAYRGGPQGSIPPGSRAPSGPILPRREGGARYLRAARRRFSDTSLSSDRSTRGR